MPVEKLLEELGLDADLIKSVTADDAKMDELKPKALEQIRHKMLEDENFYTSLDKTKLPKDWFNEKFDEGVNKIAGMSKQSIDKHFGLTDEEKSTFTEEEKKDISKYVAKATSIFKAKSGVPADISKLQDENSGLKTRLKELEDSQTSLQEKFESDMKEKLTAKETETLALIGAAELQPFVPVNVSLIFDKAFNAIKSKYSVIVESGKATLRKKDNPAFKVEKGKGGFMDLKDALIDEFKAMGAWKDEDGKEKEKVKVVVQPDKGVLSSERLKKQIEEEEKFLKQ